LHAFVSPMLDTYHVNFMYLGLITLIRYLVNNTNYEAPHYEILSSLLLLPSP
jgi:hypothetical protein